VKPATHTRYDLDFDESCIEDASNNFNCQDENPFQEDYSKPLKSILETGLKTAKFNRPKNHFNPERNSYPTVWTSISTSPPTIPVVQSNSKTTVHPLEFRYKSKNIHDEIISKYPTVEEVVPSRTIDPSGSATSRNQKNSDRNGGLNANNSWTQHLLEPKSMNATTTFPFSTPAWKSTSAFPSFSVGTGLKNIGNSCYMSAVIQVRGGGAGED